MIPTRSSHGTRPHGRFREPLAKRLRPYCGRMRTGRAAVGAGCLLLAAGVVGCSLSRMPPEAVLVVERPDAATFSASRGSIRATLMVRSSGGPIHIGIGVRTIVEENAFSGNTPNDVAYEDVGPGVARPRPREPSLRIEQPARLHSIAPGVHLAPDLLTGSRTVERVDERGPHARNNVHSKPFPSRRNASLHRKLRVSFAAGGRRVRPAWKSATQGGVSWGGENAVLMVRGAGRSLLESRSGRHSLHSAGLWQPHSVRAHSISNSRIGDSDVSRITPSDPA